MAILFNRYSFLVIGLLSGYLLNPVLNIDKEGVNQNDLPHLATSKTLGISTQFAETADTKKIIASKINNNGTAIETAAGEVRVK